MPVHRQKKDTTPHILGSTQQQPASPLPDQQEFHQHLRVLAQIAVRTVLELVMREEFDAFIGAAWGESRPKGEKRFPARRKHQEAVCSRGWESHHGKISRGCPSVCTETGRQGYIAKLIQDEQIIPDEWVDQACNLAAQERYEQTKRLYQRILMIDKKV